MKFKNNEYKDSPYEPCLNYDRDFDPETKLSEKHNIIVEYVSTNEILDGEDVREIHRTLQRK